MSTSHFQTDLPPPRFGRKMLRRGTLLLTLTGTLGFTLLSGCQEKVVSRRGIGAEETNPTVSERAKTDRLSDFIWEDDRKRY